MRIRGRSFFCFCVMIVAVLLSLFLEIDLGALVALSSLIVILILYFLIYVSQKRKERVLKERIGLNRKERNLLKDYIKEEFLVENKKYVKKFIVIWLFASVIITYVFVNVLADWRTTGWETVGTLAIFFTVMGLILIKKMNKSNAENKFPNVRVLFQKYDLFAIKICENYLNYRQTEPVDGKYTIIDGIFGTELQNASNIEYSLRIQEMRYKYFINIEVKVDLCTMIQNKGIQPWDTYEVMKIFDEYFVPGGILEKENIKYAEGIFVLSFCEEHRLDPRIICEYLIGVLKTCQELEILYSRIETQNLEYINTNI